MTDDREDDPLRWAGDADPTAFEAPRIREKKPRRGQALTTEAAAAIATSAADHGVPDSDLSDAPAGPAPLPAVTGSVLLVTLGILAGVYLLYTVGWVITLQRDRLVLVSAFDQVMSQARHYLSIAAPAAWYATTLLLTRDRRPISRLLCLLLGALLLAPIPFIVGA